MDKTKVLVLSDSPAGSTGFSTVSMNILKDLHATGQYDILSIGINYDGCGYDREKFPYEIIPATSGINERYRDLYGGQRCLDELASGQFEILFIIQDMAVIQPMVPQLKKLKDKFGFKIVMYIPVDSNLDTRPTWASDVLSIVDYPVAYTEFAKKEIQKSSKHKDIRVCHHGVDTTEFKPVRDTLDRVKAINDFFHPIVPITQEELDKRYVIINVNRNQIRKDYLRSFQIIKRLKDSTDLNPLYLVVAQTKDQGGDIVDIAKQVGLEYGKDWLSPVGYQAGLTISAKIRNIWYNLADCVFSTTLGEGFGLSSIEGMACGVPVVFPRNTALIEIIGEEEERGLLVCCGGDLITYGVYDSSLVRPRVSIEDGAECLRSVVESSTTASRKEKALAWAKEHDWREIGKFWVKLFAEAAK